MSDIALYYPWTRVRDETWLKAAALYWPRLAVLAPEGYRRIESPTARVLRDEFGFLMDADPTFRARDLADEFLTLIGQDADAMVRRYGWPAEFPTELYAFADHGYTGRLVDDGRVTWLHLGKVSPSLVRSLAATGLAVLSPDRSSIAVHPRLGSVYLTALADRVAQANDLVPVTDQPRHHGTLNGWTLETLTEVLLADDMNEQPPAARTADDVVAMYVAAAIRTVVPAGLEHVPVERIVQGRRTLAAEFDAFREHVDSLSGQLAELARTEDPTVLRARLERLTDRNLRRSIDDLERGLRQLKLEPVRAVLGMTSLSLPVAVGWIPEAVGLPVVVGAGGMVAATLVGSSARAREQAQDRRRSAAGYLLGLRDELNPSGVVDRARRMFSRASRRA